MTRHLRSFVPALAAAFVSLILAIPALAQPAASTAPHTARARPTATAHASPSAHAPSAPSSDTPDGVVNIQTASAEQLQLLPGIGPSKAQAIITFRDTHPFHRIEDLLRVRGIGRATFRRLRSMITVTGSTTMTTDVRAGRTHATPADGEESPEGAAQQE